MRLIDADAFYKAQKKRCGGYSVPFIGTCTTDNAMLDLELEKAPTVDAEPVRHGENENQKYHEVDEFRCSECGLHLEDWTRYVYDEDSDEEYAQEYVFKRCPECGAKIGVQ